MRAAPDDAGAGRTVYVGRYSTLNEGLTARHDFVLASRSAASSDAAGTPVTTPSRRTPESGC